MFHNSFALDKAVLLDGTTRVTCKGKSIKQLTRLGTFSEYIVVPEILVVKVRRCRDYSTCARFDLFQKNTTVKPGRFTPPA